MKEISKTMAKSTENHFTIFFKNLSMVINRLVEEYVQIQRAFSSGINMTLKKNSTI